MSKQRAQARARRLAEAERRAAEQEQRQRSEAIRSRRRARRELAWRQSRLWRHGAAFSRDRERLAAIVIGVLVALLLGYLITGSLAAVLVLGLIALLAAPAAYALLFNRK